MKANDRAGVLRTALVANATFSTVCGATFLAAAGPISEAIGLTMPEVLMVIGGALLVFAAGLVRNARRANVNTMEAWTVVAMDGAWVVGSAAVIVMGVLNTSGNWAVAVVADVVLAFAVWQVIGLRKMATATQVVHSP